jgi:hypothetical protein
LENDTVLPVPFHATYVPAPRLPLPPGPWAALLASITYEPAPMLYDQPHVWGVYGSSAARCTLTPWSTVSGAGVY